jgi:asparagine synthase (glutamine-hydrolysing)
VCGITGVFDRADVDLGRFYSAHTRLAHRGPDDEGFRAGSGPDDAGASYAGDRTTGRWRDLDHLRNAGPTRWVLGYHRLAIIDLSENGHQPFAGRAGRRWLVYNGEIYNYRELRADLQGLGHEFVTQTDTEVVAASYDEWGTGCFSRFNGMWALAVYDVDSRRLVLSRDRFGVKPLYYHHGKSALLFGSELKFLAGLIDLGLDETAAAEYLAESRIDHRPQTLHPEVRQLPPGHLAAYDYATNRLRVEAYWKLDRAGTRDTLELPQAADEFSRLFDSAIDLRMRSDVPVGSLLSGGLDSSAIVTNLHRRRRFPDDGFHSFSAVYRESAYSERAYVEAVAKQADGLQPHFVLVEPDRLAAGLAEVIRTQDAPFRSLSVYCQWLLYQDVRRSSPLVVLLNGQGADEAFGGYTGHYLRLLASHALHGRLAELWRDGRWMRRNRAIGTRALLLSLVGGIAHALRRPVAARRHTIAHPLFSRSLEVPEPIFHRDPFEQTLRSNLMFSALPEYLRYEDRNSMAYSLETRLPFLDYRLVEWAFTLPERLKLTRGETKRVVRHATAPYVPEKVRARTDKMGFTSPQEVWQRRLLEPWLRAGIQRVNLSFLDRDRVRAGFDDYLAGEQTDHFFWFRLACFGWWQEPAPS